jgi:hypothetical protein
LLGAELNLLLQYSLALDDTSPWQESSYRLVLPNELITYCVIKVRAKLEVKYSKIDTPP